MVVPLVHVNPFSLMRNFGMQIYPDWFKPRFGRIIVTRNCILKCKMCTLWRRAWPEPSTNLIKHWIDELAELGVEDISIGGGEPFIRKDLVKLVEHIQSYGVRCGITTSGWLTDRVPFPPADYFEISIDGAKPETHDKIRGAKGSWEKAVKTVKLATKKASVSQLNFVLQADNYTELVDYCKFARSLGVGVSIIPISLKLAAQPSIAKKMAKIDPAYIRSLIEQAMDVGNVLNTREFFDIYFNKLENGPCRQTCLFPYEGILIFTNSYVYPCGNFDRPVGKLTEKKKIKDIFQSYENIRKEVSRAGNHKRCTDCTYGDIIPRRGLGGNLKFFAQETFRKRVYNPPWEGGSCPNE
jgi:MoaA/NifB/PqqE/SkfB family radical SAM enzyme